MTTTLYYRYMCADNRRLILTLAKQAMTCMGKRKWENTLDKRPNTH